MFINKDRQIRSGWKIVIVLFIATFIASIFAIFVVLSGLDETKIGWGIAVFTQETALIVVPLVFWKLLDKKKVSEMGLPSLKLKGSLKDLLIGLLFGAISISIVFLVLIATKNAFVESWTPVFSFDLLINLVFFVMVGFAEEIFTRGYCMSVLRQTKSIVAVVFVTSVLFALMHSGNPGIGILPYINLFLVGLLFTYMYIKGGNIWMCIGYHITWNYFQGNIFGFLVSGTYQEGLLSTTIKENNIINGGSFGPEGGLIVTAIILLGFLFVKLYYRNSNYDFIKNEHSKAS